MFYLFLFLFFTICTVATILTAMIALDMNREHNERAVSAVLWIFCGVYAIVAGATVAEAVVF